MNIKELIYKTLIAGDSYKTLLKGLGITLQISLLSIRAWNTAGDGDLCLSKKPVSGDPHHCRRIYSTRAGKPGSVAFDVDVLCGVCRE